MQVPEGWEKIRLGQFMTFKNGLNADKEQYGSGMPFVNVMDVFNNDILTAKKLIGKIQIREKQIADNQLKNGDVLFNRTSETYDEIAMSAVFIDSEPATFGGFVIRGRPNKNTLNEWFSVYAFQAQSFRNQVIKLGQGAVRANIGQKDLAKVCLLIPPLSEQTKIAEILSTWDNAITTTEQLLANSQQQKKALMQQLLTGKKRLLDDNGQRFAGDWESVLLGDIAKITTGSSNRQDSTLVGKYTFFDRSEDIRTSDIYLFDCEAVIVPGEGQDFVPKYFVGKFDLHQRTYAIMDFQHAIGIYIYYAIYFLRRYFLSQAVGSTVKSLRLSMFEKMPIKLPSLQEQQKIAAVLAAADDEIRMLEQKIDQLKQEKKALMQQLLTGKRRVLMD